MIYDFALRGSYTTDIITIYISMLNYQTFQTSSFFNKNEFQSKCYELQVKHFGPSDPGKIARIIQELLVFFPNTHHIKRTMY
jgi:hypothetical protein